MKSTSRSLFLAIVLCASAAIAKAEILYDLTILGTLGEYDCTTALSINNSGQIVGVGAGQSHYRAILFDATGNGQNIDLGTLGGQDSRANSINNNGQIVGWAVGSSYFEATLFDPTGNKNNVSLGTLNGPYSQAEAINDSGQIVGEVWPLGGNSRAVLFDSSGNNNSIILDKRQGNPASGCSSINNHGQIVGGISSYSPDSGWHGCAVLFDPSGLGINVELGTIAGGGDSYASHINDDGQIVGSAINSSGYSQATLFDPTGNGYNVILGSLSGYEQSEAYSINNKGQIVGLATAFDCDTGMTVWTAVLFDSSGNGNNTDLNTLIDQSSGWNLMYARAINDSGWIVGYAMNPLGEGEAFLLTPIPEPAPPAADADGPYIIFVGDMLTLDASGSTDHDNDIVSYLWDLNDDGVFEIDAGDEATFSVDYALLQSIGLLVDNTYTIRAKVTDSVGQNNVASSTLTILPIPALPVFVDIKPRSCPNPLNVRSSGVLPVAILGTADFDVFSIDPTSIRLAGVRPLRSSYEDVAAPAGDPNDCACTEDGPDGFLDLSLKFKTQEIVTAIGDVNDCQVLALQLTGVLFDERPIEGSDCVVILGRHKSFNKADFNRDGKVDWADYAAFSENWLQSTAVED